MASLAKPDPISPAVYQLIEKGVNDHAGVRQLSTLLPTDDAELVRWIETAASQIDGGIAERLLCAAALAGRSLPASLLPSMMFINPYSLRLGWIAWRMTGNVAEELLRGCEGVNLGDEDQARFLLVAAAWWKEHRPNDELPRRIARSALRLWRDNPSNETRYTLTDIAIFTGDAALREVSEKAGLRLRAGLTEEKRREQALAFLRLPFQSFICEKANHDYRSNRPMRRAVARIGNNEPCPCGSGEKYKRCCRDTDRVRLRDSSWMPGVTQKELSAVPGEARTKEWLDSVRPVDLGLLELDDLPQELHAHYITCLQASNQLDEAVGVFRALGVPKELHGRWMLMLDQVVVAWRPDLTRELFEIFPEAEKELGMKPSASARFAMAGDDPAAALQELEDSVRALLQSGNLDELRSLAVTLLHSPYRGLGILAVRSLLPIADGKVVPALFDRLLDARAKMELSPEDEFSDWMAEHALHKARKNGTETNQEAQDKLEAKMEELRRLKEEKARNDRELVRLQRNERAEAAEASKIIPFPPPDKARERELERKNKELSALVKERNEEKRTLLRDLQKANKEVETLRESAALQEKSEAKSDDERYVVEGKQPVRIIVFPKDFPERLTAPPPHIGRAAMTRLGRLAAGEPAAFDHLKQLKAYPGVLRARISDRYRLLFSLLPDRIRVVDLTYRPDLDATADRLKLCGLPPVG